jgi:hypothetical protein
MLMNDELESMRKEAVVAYFRVKSLNAIQEIGENHE